MKTETKNPILIQFSNIFILVLVLVMNAAATTLPLNGITTEEISDALPSYFTPAGYTFAIWGLIYTALIAFAIYQAQPAKEHGRFLVKLAGSLSSTGFLTVPGLLPGIMVITPYPLLSCLSFWQH